jgi:hypothetical protein
MRKRVKKWLTGRTVYIYIPATLNVADVETRKQGQRDASSASV